MENYRETFEALLLPVWGRERFDRWWSTPKATLWGRFTPHQLCLHGLAEQLRRDVVAQIAADKDPRGIIRDCQAILTSYLSNEKASAHDTISELLGILDGPRARAALGPPEAVSSPKEQD